MLKNWHGVFLCYYKVVGDIVISIFLIIDNLGMYIMQKIYIHSWLNKEYSPEGLVQSANNEVELDFSNVEDIRLKDIERLLDLQKIAVFNEIKIRVENMKPHIITLFEQTGLYKLVSFGNPIPVKIRKRQGLLFD